MHLVAKEYHFLTLSLEPHCGKARYFQKCLHIQNSPPLYKVLLETMPSFKLARPKKKIKIFEK